MESKLVNRPQSILRPSTPSGDYQQPSFSTRQNLSLPSISVIIPTYNEAKNLPHVLPLIPEWVYEIILVDGLSTDDTVAVAKELRPDIRVVMERRRGKGLALIAGCMAAKGEIIVTIDADGSNDPAEISRFVGALMSGADFAKGSRFLQGGGTSDMPYYRKVGNWGFVKTVQLLFGGQYSDLCYGYNAFWARVLPKLNLDSPGFEIETTMNVRALMANLKIVEVPSFEDKRIYGQGQLRAFPDGWRVLKTIFGEWLTKISSRKLLVGNTALSRISDWITPRSSLDGSSLDD